MSPATADTLMTYDVVQIGYGPVSQVLALMLGRLGYRVAVVERWTEPYVLPRAVCIDHEAARILHAIGLGEGLAKVSQPAPAYQWFNAAWEKLLSIDWSAESISGGPEVNFVHQPSLEAEFRAEVSRLANVDLLLGWEFVGQTDHGDYVEVSLRAVEGTATRTLRSRFLIGADGANSAVRESLGIGREDRGFQADWLIADMKLKPGVTLDIPDCGQYCNPARPTTIVPGGQAGRPHIPSLGIHALAPRDAGGARGRKPSSGSCSVSGSARTRPNSSAMPSTRSVRSWRTPGGAGVCCWPGMRRTSCRHSWARACARASATLGT